MNYELVWASVWRESVRILIGLVLIYSTNGFSQIQNLKQKNQGDAYISISVAVMRQ